MKKKLKIHGTSIDIDGGELITAINKDKIVEDIINKIVIVSHSVYNSGRYYQYVLDDIGLLDIRQKITEIIKIIGVIGEK